MQGMELLPCCTAVFCDTVCLPGSGRVFSSTAGFPFRLPEGRPSGRVTVYLQRIPPTIIHAYVQEQAQDRGRVNQRADSRCRKPHCQFSYFVFMILHRTARMPSEHPVSENSTLFMVLEVLFYMAVSFILLTVFTHNLSESKIRSRSFPKRLLAALVISVVVYFLAPYMNRAGDVKIILAARRLFNPMVLLKCSFMLAVVTLYGKIYELIVLQQRMTVENERLKTENLRSRYDVLINQMNPHFFSIRSIRSPCSCGRTRTTMRSYISTGCRTPSVTSSSRARAA